MNDGLKLTTYFGERARAGRGFLADAFTELHARHELRTSLLLRGAEGFGSAQHLRTDRLLSLSEDLPLVSVAVDTSERIHAVLDDLAPLTFTGLVTLERARLVTAQPPSALPAELGAEAKLTIYVGRQARIAGKPAHEALVALLHDRGVAGATVLLGVDGTVHGVRQRARFFGRNADVPLMVIAVGAADRIGAVLPELHALLPRPLMTLERGQVCKRDGKLLAPPRPVPESDVDGLEMWQKLMVYVGEQARHDGRPLAGQLVRALRQAGAAGATSVRGIWGYHGDHRPHGDVAWQVRRRVPVVTVIVDTPERCQRWFEIVDRLTAKTGLVTSEAVLTGSRGPHLVGTSLGGCPPS